MNGEVIAENVTTYSMIAVITPRLTIDKNNPQHVVDHEHTAKVLSKYIDMKESDILKILDQKLDQVEFGTAGKNISSSKKK
ncbi:penicillin-binding protein 2B [Brochothrix thermosphacta DSM 20171 = FSL F6-1036]|nr:penicillin-binding protein 2B [Brochothrix thermosphacta DSM 20171 = FSL F6-1036]